MFDEQIYKKTIQGLCNKKDAIEGISLPVTMLKQNQRNIKSNIQIQKIYQKSKKMETNGVGRHSDDRVGRHSDNRVDELIKLQIEIGQIVQMQKEHNIKTNKPRVSRKLSNFREKAKKHVLTMINLNRLSNGNNIITNQFQQQLANNKVVKQFMRQLGSKNRQKQEHDRRLSCQQYDSQNMEKVKRAVGSELCLKKNRVDVWKCDDIVRKQCQFKGPKVCINKDLEEQKLFSKKIQKIIANSRYSMRCVQDIQGHGSWNNTSQVSANKRQSNDDNDKQLNDNNIRQLNDNNRYRIGSTQCVQTDRVYSFLGQSKNSTDKKTNKKCFDDIIQNIYGNSSKKKDKKLQ